MKVSDIGYSEDSYEEPVTAARLDGVPAVTLVVSKQSGENTVTTANDVERLRSGAGRRLPKDIQTNFVADLSTFIEDAIDSIQHHLVEGSFFASIIIFLFLANIRTTLIAAIAIPTSIISTFALMAAMGFTLNQITMLALTLMVGIVIDDAIIVLENIFRFMEEKGMTPYQAAIEGTREIGLAVIATTMSLLAVFVPVGFMGGIVGRFMSSFRVDVGVCDCGVVAGQLHADADAFIALHQTAGRRMPTVSRSTRRRTPKHLPTGWTFSTRRC